ncbi:MAG: dynamin family protein [Acidimicrobiia bacterium]
MSTIVPHAKLRAEVDTLADVAGSIDFALATESQDDRIARRNHLLGILRRYLEPRLADPSHPVVVAVFGPTGSGKSTLVNTLVGRSISAAGVLRPTTRRAVVWVHHRHAGVIESTLGPTGPLEIVGDEHPVLGSLAIVDTPDIDSIAEEHRLQTSAILEAADVGIAVTTPQRYADAVPWEVLGDLTERSLDLVVVMNRTTRRSAGAVIDLAGLLRDAGVRGIESADDIVVIQEQRIRSDGRLHGYALRNLARRLEVIASDHSGVAQRGIEAACRHAAAVGRELAREVEAQSAEGEALRSVVAEAVIAQQEEIGIRLQNGDLVRQEVVVRWQRMIGVSDLAELVSRGVSRLADLAFPRKALSAERITRVDQEVRTELVELGLRRAEQAASSIELAWSLSTAGAALLEGVEVDWSEVRADLDESMAEWQAEVVAMVADTGRTRHRLARAASVGINAAGTLLLLGVFASTGGLTGAELGVAAGAAAAQQTVLERVFGAAAASRLTKSAQVLLSDNLGQVLTSATAAHRQALKRAVDDHDLVERLEEACGALTAALEDHIRD